MNSPRFGHSPAALDFWRHLIQAQVDQHPTPFFLFSAAPLQEALAELDQHFGSVPARHWLSCKTQPLRPLLQWWQKQNRPIEVVSEFELRAVLQEGFPPEQILVNGPAKHHWLPGQAVAGLRVNLDSPSEIPVLAPLASRLSWKVGLRINTLQEFDPQAPACPTQFGMTSPEMVHALKELKRHQVVPEIAHFHLRSNVTAAWIYERALEEMAQLCNDAGFAPRCVDCGGGFPPPLVLTRKGSRINAEFSLQKMAQVCQRALPWFPQAKEIWFENGRWLSARAGVLVVRIRDVKERRGMRHLICDGGRTLHALLSIWEQHECLPLRPPAGPSTLSTVCGPTCMAFDQLARRPMPASLQAGDVLIWFDAGAYHLSWETRFSHGLAAVLWHEGSQTRQVRTAQTFAEWWGQWR